MNSTSDDAPVVTHISPVAQSGFMMLPNAVLLREDLKPVSKLVYGYLKHLAWAKHSDAVGPLRSTIATDLKIAEDTVRLAIRELQKAPCLEHDDRADAPMLVVAKRRGLGKTNVYLINEPLLPGSGESPSSGPLESSGPERGDLPFSPSIEESEVLEKDPLESPTVETSLSASSEDEPVESPTIGLVNGRNLPLDMLFAVCGWDAGNVRRMGQVSAALYGRRHKTTGRMLVQGITDLYWLEVRRFVELHPEHAGRLDEIRADGAAYAEALAKSIRKKADLYRQTLPAGAMLTPTALASWWLDLEKQASSAGGASADEIARMDFGD